ncbi:MAG TPA: LapA family protein [Arthrobacter sp.]|uniref:LapA family protein n=1 Tax=Pseudarthrobacter sp. NPDC058119 TaxID=3346348 RepID=UPI002CAE4D3A|nr:LapA family protein [Arthrobacter sp.]
MSEGQYTPGPDRAPETETGRTPSGLGQPAADRATTQGTAPSYPAGGPATPATATAPAPAGGAPERKVTRAGVIWAAVVAALVLLILLIIFILQNQELVLVKFLGFEGSVPLGMALFIAAVTGGVLVAAAGGARILQLRRSTHRSRTAVRR